jgi:ornithine decarboxylase
MNTVKVSPKASASQYQQLITQYGAPLLILDCDKVRQQYLGLKAALPNVELYYAIKSLPHPAVVETLNKLGAGFDIATSGEIDLIGDLSVAPRGTIHTHPIKRDKDIRDALRYGCTTFVVDNQYELEKFTPFKNRVGILLRLSFRSSNAIVDLSKKFGCIPEEVPSLLKLARELGLHVKGFSFHVGSQCSDASKQVEAIHTCNELIREHHGSGAAPLSILDIGGGFPVSYESGGVNDEGCDGIDINTFCAPIREALTQLPKHVQVIAEPGRHISAPSMTGICTVMGKARRSGFFWYYLDDGVYGSYSGQIFDHVNYPLEFFSDNSEHFTSVLAGPTCDSIDVIAEGVQIPELEVDDLVVGHMMGAYTAATATDFNSFPKAKIIVINP